MKTTGSSKCPAKIFARRDKYLVFKDAVELDGRGTKHPRARPPRLPLDLPSIYSFRNIIPISDGASLVLTGHRSSVPIPVSELSSLMATNELVLQYTKSPRTLTPEQVREAMFLIEPFGPDETGALTATLNLPTRAEFKSFPLLAAIGKLHDPCLVQLVPSFESVGEIIVRAGRVFDALKSGCDPKLAATVNDALRARTHIEAVSKAFEGIERESSPAFADAKAAVARVDGVFGGLGQVMQAVYDAVANTPSLKDVVQFIAGAD